MVWGGGESSPKLTKNQPPSTVFLCRLSLFFLLNRTFGHHHSHHLLSHYSLHHNQTHNHLTWWSHCFSLSFSLLYKTLIPLYHCDPNSSSGNHLVQELSSFPTAARSGDSILSHSNSNRELPLSFANLYFFIFQLQPAPAAGLTTFSHTVCHQPGRQLFPH